VNSPLCEKALKKFEDGLNGKLETEEENRKALKESISHALGKDSNNNCTCFYCWPIMIIKKREVYGK